MSSFSQLSIRSHHQPTLVVVQYRETKATIALPFENLLGAHSSSRDSDPLSSDTKKLAANRELGKAKGVLNVAQASG